MKKLFYIVALSTLLLSACGKEDAPKETKVDKEMTVEDVVGSVIDDKYTVNQKDGNVSIKIEDTDIGKGSKSQMIKDSTKILADISKIEGVKAPIIIWFAPLTGSDGKQDMKEVMSISFDEETFKKVDWNNYNELNIESLATVYKQSESIGD